MDSVLLGIGILVAAGVAVFLLLALIGSSAPSALSGRGYNTEFVELLDTMAHEIRVWIANADMPAAARAREVEPSYREILEKHGVQ